MWAHVRSVLAGVMLLAGCGGAGGGDTRAAAPGSPSPDPGASPAPEEPVSSPGPQLTVERVDADPECDELVPSEIPEPVTIKVDFPPASGRWCGAGTSDGGGHVAVVSPVLSYVTPFQIYDPRGEAQRSFILDSELVPLPGGWLALDRSRATPDVAVVTYGGDGTPALRTDLPRLPFHATWWDLAPDPAGGALLVVSTNGSATCAGQARRLDAVGVPAGATAPVGCDVRAVGVSAAGEALVVEPDQPNDGRSPARLRWLRPDGSAALPPARDPYLPAGNHGRLAPLLDGSLASPDFSRRYPHLAPTSEPAPAWLASRRGQLLRLASGRRAYAFFRKVPGSSDCAQAGDLVAPSGRLCATFTFRPGERPVRSPDGTCVGGAIDQGLDGTVVQQLRSGGCTWRFWPRLLARPAPRR